MARLRTHDITAVTRAAAVVSAVAAVLAGCAVGSDVAGVRLERARDLRVVGDSLARGAASQIERAVEAGLGGWEAYVDGVNSATITERMPAIRAAAGKDPDAMVIVLGTNDTFRRPADLEARVLEVMRTTRHVPCVLWVTVPAPDPLATALNVLVVLHGFEYGVRVVDWANASKGRDHWFVGDAVHNTTEGKDALARVIAVELARCERREDT